MSFKCWSLLAILIATPAFATSAQKTMCGWLDNSTPQNYSLIDARGEWELSRQGGFTYFKDDGTADQEKTDVDQERLNNLTDKLPEAPSSKDYWKNYNPAGYGHGCVCLYGAITNRDPDEHGAGQVWSIERAKYFSVETVQQR